MCEDRSTVVTTIAPRPPYLRKGCIKPGNVPLNLQQETPEFTPHLLSIAAGNTLTLPLPLYLHLDQLPCYPSFGGIKRYYHHHVHPYAC